MDRREALKRIGLLLGSTASSTAITRVLDGWCAPSNGASYALQTLTPDQNELLATVAEWIIPKTNTPGAREVGVSAFIDRMLTAGYGKEDRARFLAGLKDLEARAQKAMGKAFLESAPEQQQAFLAELDAEAAEALQAGTTDEQPFFVTMKALTLVGYYASEAGATQELKYVHVAGSYDGDVPYAEVGRAYA